MRMIAIVLVVGLVACGAEGPPGPKGAPGAQGPEGPAGTSGASQLRGCCATLETLSLRPQRSRASGDRVASGSISERLARPFSATPAHTSHAFFLRASDPRVSGITGPLARSSSSSRSARSASAIVGGCTPAGGREDHPASPDVSSS